MKTLDEITGFGYRAAEIPQDVYLVGFTVVRRSRGGNCDPIKRLNCSCQTSRFASIRKRDRRIETSWPWDGWNDVRPRTFMPPFWNLTRHENRADFNSKIALAVSGYRNKYITLLFPNEISEHESGLPQFRARNYKYYEDVKETRRKYGLSVGSLDLVRQRKEMSGCVQLCFSLPFIYFNHCNPTFAPHYLHLNICMWSFSHSVAKWKAIRLSRKLLFFLFFDFCFKVRV